MNTDFIDNERNEEYYYNFNDDIQNKIPILCMLIDTNISINSRSKLI